MSKFAEEFKKAYEEKYEYFYKRYEQRGAIAALDEEISLLKSCIAKKSERSSVYPIILGNSLFRISITSIGSFPPYKYTPTIIYPVGYTCKKSYKQHSAYKKTSRDKVLYICSIENDGFKITADDGFVWSGDGCWDQFAESVGCGNDYKSFKEFSGLAHPSVTKLIEQIGDTGSLAGYIPLEKRHPS